MSALATIAEAQFTASTARLAERKHRPFISLLAPALPGALRAARAITRNAEDAEDVQQTAAMRAFAHLGEFKGRDETPERLFAAWFTRIAANEAIDTVRRRHAGRVISFDDPTPAGEENPLLGSLATAPDDNPEQHYARLELLRHVADAIEQLEPRMRRVCLLRDVAQLSTRETAEKLGIPSATVRVRLFRARLALRERLRHLLENRHNAHPERTSSRARLSVPCMMASAACGD